MQKVSEGGAEIASAEVFTFSQACIARSRRAEDQVEQADRLTSLHESCGSADQIEPNESTC